MIGKQKDAERFLMLLRDNPDLLPAAPVNVTAAQMDFRRSDEMHDCLRCGKCAERVYVADTKAGPRWLDLCSACAAALAAVNSTNN